MKGKDSFVFFFLFSDMVDGEKLCVASDCKTKNRIQVSSALQSHVWVLADDS